MRLSPEALLIMRLQRDKDQRAVEAGLVVSATTSVTETPEEIQAHKQVQVKCPAEFIVHRFKLGQE